MLVLMCQKAETKEVTTREKITDDFVVQNNFLTDIAIIPAVLHFGCPDYMQ